MSQQWPECFERWQRATGGKAPAVIWVDGKLDAGHGFETMAAADLEAGRECLSWIATAASRRRPPSCHCLELLDAAIEQEKRRGREAAKQDQMFRAQMHAEAAIAYSFTGRLLRGEPHKYGDGRPIPPYDTPDRPAESEPLCAGDALYGAVEAYRQARAYYLECRDAKGDAGTQWHRDEQKRRAETRMNAALLNLRGPLLSATILPASALARKAAEAMRKRCVLQCGKTQRRLATVGLAATSPPNTPSERLHLAAGAHACLTDIRVLPLEEEHGD